MRLREHLREAIAKPADRCELRRMRIDICGGDCAELLVTEQLLQSRHVRGKRLGQPDAIGIGVDAEPDRGRNCRRGFHRSDDRGVAAEHVTLQIALQFGERVHAASAAESARDRA